jgi:hypothetical protein
MIVFSILAIIIAFGFFYVRRNFRTYQAAASRAD